MRDLFILAGVAAVSSLSCTVAGQVQEPARSFEVASLKQAAPQQHGWSSYGLRGGPGTDNPGRFTATNMSLQSLLTEAYGLEPYQVVGSGLDEAKFDIVAKVPLGATREQLNQMLAALLRERFKLQFHWDSRNVKAYVLSAGKDGPKLTANTGGVRSERAAGGKAGNLNSQTQAPRVFNTYLPDGQMRFVFTASPISRLADLIALWSKRPVFDETGLRERYDFSLDYTPEGAERSPGDAVGAPSLSSALRELGLKLETREAVVKRLIVDHFEKTPLAN